jgi:hypothetical protein
MADIPLRTEAMLQWAHPLLLPLIELVAQDLRRIFLEQLVLQAASCWESGGQPDVAEIPPSDLVVGGDSAAESHGACLKV